MGGEAGTGEFTAAMGLSRQSRPRFAHIATYLTRERKTLMATEDGYDSRLHALIQSTPVNMLALTAAECPNAREVLNSIAAQGHHHPDCERARAAMRLVALEQQKLAASESSGSEMSRQSESPTDHTVSDATLIDRTQPDQMLQCAEPTTAELGDGSLMGIPLDEIAKLPTTESDSDNELALFARMLPDTMPGAFRHADDDGRADADGLPDTDGDKGMKCGRHHGGETTADQPPRARRKHHGRAHSRRARRLSGEMSPIEQPEGVAGALGRPRLPALRIKQQGPSESPFPPRSILREGLRATVPPVQRLHALDWRGRSCDPRMSPKASAASTDSVLTVNPATTGAAQAATDPMGTDAPVVTGTVHTSAEVTVPAAVRATIESAAPTAAGSMDAVTPMMRPVSTEANRGAEPVSRKQQAPSLGAFQIKPIPNTKNVSGYKGVYPGRKGRWQAQVDHKTIGSFATAWEAGIAVATEIAKRDFGFLPASDVFGKGPPQTNV